MKTEFFVARISKASLAIYRALSRRPDITGKDYAYYGYTLEEVALLAKNDPNAMKECLERTQVIRIKATRAYSSRVRCPFLDVYPKAEEALRKTVEKFCPEKGPFTHLLSRVLKLTLSSYNKSLAIHRKRVLGNGTLEKGESSPFLSFQDHVSDSKSVAFTLDMDEYLEMLEPRERRILLLYDARHNYREIGQYVSLSSTAVSEKVSAMLQELDNRFKRKLI